MTTSSSSSTSSGRSSAPSSVERAVLEDVHLYALEQGKRLEPRLDFSHLAGLGEQPLRTEPVHHLDPGRVVRDPQVVVSQRLGALGHFEHRRPAVAPVGVRMHIPLVLAEVEV